MKLPVLNYHPGGLVCFLQNAWSPVYAGKKWHRTSWLRALSASRSGKRLKVMIDDFSICENTTPIVGGTPDSVVPADFGHIKQVLTYRKPRLVIACGKQAEEALLTLWGGSLLIVPHPACRVLTDKLYERARQYINDEDFGSVHGQIALRQTTGGIAYEDLTRF